MHICYCIEILFRFLPYIFDDVYEPLRDNIRNSRYTSVLVDSSTDISTKDLESIYVRHLVDGVPTNAFIYLEELQTVTAAGHKKALEDGQYKIHHSIFVDHSAYSL